MSHSVRRTDRGQVLRLEATTPEGIKIQRDLHLAFGDSPLIQMSTRLVNMRDVPVPAKIRVHPEIKLAVALDDVELFLREDDAAWETMPLRSFTSTEEYSPRGRWGAYNRRDQVGLLNTFNADEAD